mmetsp:Transcript_11584/g.25784  ORF Transcript_11584/g.25784 Transcript_11584/m.25784 type:complete len:301 (+) Transcript_11584:426-1328(+)|eukprot:CAMPEP_0173219214 /NCGR_PEP_ID=MMETSP1142-20121109/1481_1 /TAXON_ID=483371 /ORGANISM="non described non described, Strain CCMP2298" /LENGTH=300 /DNA_ID=CAMNT_0014146989 /DNA_START=346 /DNA_END=1248 /DNA_ORIENTATION=+
MRTASAAAAMTFVRRRLVASAMTQRRASSQMSEIERLLKHVKETGETGEAARLIGNLLEGAARSNAGASANTLSVGNFAKIDLNRSGRVGFPEVIFASGKEPQHFAEIMSAMRGSEDIVIATRVNQEQRDLLDKQLGDAITHVKSCNISYLPGRSVSVRGTVAVLCAGTSDYAVAEEAATLLELSGVQTVTRLYDVGVAGLYRLLSNLDKIEDADVIIVCAGMDGALPSVVGGLVKAPVIAVPTSVGYGAAFHGVSALLTMLNTCAPGVSVVNIDNGFGAAVCAFKVLKKMQKGVDAIDR